jgi:CheY-like chemotaxis protein
MATRVLVINDDESILELFKLILEGEGFEVFSSEEAIENIADVERIQPDLVILDLKMGMQQEGWTMMQKIRMYPPTQHIPMILCTAALNEVREQEGTLQDKGIPVVYKPFAIDDLLQAIHVVLPSSDENSRKKKKK